MDPVGCRAVSSYYTSDTWRLLRRFNAEAEGVPMRHQQRRLVLLAAFCGSPASQTAAAIMVPAVQVVQVGRGRAAFDHPRSIERLHDWIMASMWRHLWRTGSDSAHEPAAIVEARAHAASVRQVPREWIRDWLIAADEVRQ